MGLRGMFLQSVDEEIQRKMSEIKHFTFRKNAHARVQDCGTVADCITLRIQAPKLGLISYQGMGAMDPRMLLAKIGKQKI